MSSTRKIDKARIEKMRKRYLQENGQNNTNIERKKENTKIKENPDENNQENMDDFLIYLAQKASKDRYYPFPDKYRITSKPGEEYTEEEFKILNNDLHDLSNHEELRNSILNIDLGIVKHGISSIHESIIEYEFKYPMLDELKRNIRYKKRWYLFHGSPIGNWHSILRTGIKNMSGTRFMTTGNAHGSGVYLAEDIRTAYGYGGNGSNHCVAVVEILVNPAPYNKGWCYVIPDDTILFPRYLLQIKKIPKFDGKEILMYYKKLRESMINTDDMLSRIEKEKDKIIKEGYFICDDDEDSKIWHVAYNGNIYRIYTDGYPFLPAIIQSSFKFDKKIKEFDDQGFYICDDSNWSPALAYTNILIDIDSHLQKYDASQTNISTTAIKRYKYSDDEPEDYLKSQVILQNTNNTPKDK